MDFIPQEPPKHPTDVPYFEDVRAEDGWSGQRTEKSEQKLRSELIEAVTRLGGLVLGWQEGVFADGKRKRDGVRITYTINAGNNGQVLRGRIDAAALPVRRDANRGKSKRMMLYMLRDALGGLWYLQQLSPGYAALMPFLLADGDKNLTQVWSERALLGLLLPARGEFVEGEVISE